MAAQPPNNSFFSRAYNDSWKRNWKAYTQDTTIDIADRYKTIQKYEAMLPKGQLNPLQKKLKIQFDNRKKVLFEEAFQKKLTKLRNELVAAEQAVEAAEVAAQQNPANSKLQNDVADAQADAAAANAALIAALPNSDVKAGCVIVFSDGKALYTKSSNGQLGFPKGDIEYKLKIPTDINTVYREDSVSAALREIEEETGFYLSPIPVPPLPTPTAVFQPFIAKLKRHGEAGEYNVRGMREYRGTRKNAFTGIDSPDGSYYLVFFLNEPSTAPGPSIQSLYQHPNRDEQIIGYEIQDQYDKNRPRLRDYNAFSKKKFTEIQTLGGGKSKQGQKHKKTRKTKRKGRKTMRSRSRSRG